MPEAFVVSSLAERYGVELSLVEVGHGALPLLLTQRLGGFQGVLKCATVNRKQTVVRFTRSDISAFLINFTFTAFCRNMNHYLLYFRDKTQHMAKEMQPEPKVTGNTMYTTSLIVAHKPDGLEGEKVHEVPVQLCKAVPGEPVMS